MKSFISSAKLSQKRAGIVTLAGCGMLLALKAILGMFTLNVSPILKIGFSFLPIAAAGMLFGPVAGGTVGALGDLVSYLMNPTGPYFPGFTVNGFLAGFLYGVFFYKKAVTLFRTFLAKATVTAVIDLCLTPLWLSILYSKAFFAVFAARVATDLILLPIDLLLLYALMKGIERERLFHDRK